MRHETYKSNNDRCEACEGPVRDDDVRSMTGYQLEATLRSTDDKRSIGAYQLRPVCRACFNLRRNDAGEPFMRWLSCETLEEGPFLQAIEEGLDTSDGI